MKLPFILLLLMLCGAVQIKAQTATPTPPPISNESESRTAETKEIGKPPVVLSTAVIKISEPNQYAVVFLRKIKAEEGKTPKLQIVFYLRNKQIGLIDEAALRRRQSEDSSGHKEYAQLMTDALNLQLPMVSDETANSPFDYATMIIQSRNFVADLNLEQANLLLKSNSLSVSYKEIAFSASVSEIGTMKKFIETQLETEK